MTSIDAIELAAWRALAGAADLETALAALGDRLRSDGAIEQLVVHTFDATSGLLETLSSPSVPMSTFELGAEDVRRLHDALVTGTPCDVARVLPDRLGRRTDASASTRCVAVRLDIPTFPSRSAIVLATCRADGARAEGVLGALVRPMAVVVTNHWRLQTLVHVNEAAQADRRALLQRLQRQDITDAIVGSNVGLREVMAHVERVAPTTAPVLLLGETGSGKEVIARALHARSARARGPILRVNCGAIAPELVDSELFGHERGSFTGATAARKGWFERADGGTLFLDEIGELSSGAQVRLLRVLQDGMLERVGGERAHHVDVRLVAATHRNLKEMVSAGTFREDLWFRISTFVIRIPPLRHRQQDIRPLAEHFAKQAGIRLGGVPLALSDADVQHLVRYRWPGNVRELAAVIERAAILGNGRRLDVVAAVGDGSTDARARTIPPPPPPSEIATLDEAMKRHIESALARTQGRIEGPDGAAAALGINPHTLRARMRKLGVDWATFRRRVGAA